VACGWLAGWLFPLLKGYARNGESVSMLGGVVVRASDL